MMNNIHSFFSLSLSHSLSGAKMSIGVPIKVLHEAEGHTVTVETMLGEVYRGKLLEAEDNMNVQVGLGILFAACLVSVFSLFHRLKYIFP